MQPIYLWKGASPASTERRGGPGSRQGGQRGRGGQGGQGGPGRPGSLGGLPLGGRRFKGLDFGSKQMEYRSRPMAGWPSESWPWAKPCTWRHSQALGAVFDHPVSLPGIVLGPGTLVKGGYGLSRPGGNLGFRV